MKVKKFMAPTMPEVMKKIRAELGKDAVILNSKEVKKGGVFGFFKKRYIEVVAVLDSNPVLPQQRKEDKTTNRPKSKHPREDDVLSEIKHLRKMIELKSQSEHDTFPKDYEMVYQHLLGQEVETTIAREMVQHVQAEHEKNERKPFFATIYRDVKQEMKQQIAAFPSGKMTFTKPIIQFVGPTGVGKTTTIAKVAASVMLKQQKKIAFITTDTYRMAAVEQLKTYARILDVPVHVAYNTHDYHDGLKKFADYDFIFVDTAGRNFRDEQYVKELAQLLNFQENMETFLTLSLTTKPNDMMAIYEQFSHLPLQGLIFTKLDETRQFGSIVNMMLKNRIGIAYLTNGQEVPDDLIIPTHDDICDLIMDDSHEP